MHNKVANNTDVQVYLVGLIMYECFHDSVLLYQCFLAENQSLDFLDCVIPWFVENTLYAPISFQETLPSKFQTYMLDFNTSFRGAMYLYLVNIWTVSEE